MREGDFVGELRRELGPELDSESESGSELESEPESTPTSAFRALKTASLIRRAVPLGGFRLTVGCGDEVGSGTAALAALLDLVCISELALHEGGERIIRCC